MGIKNAEFYADFKKAKRIAKNSPLKVIIKNLIKKLVF